ncbi:MAG: hypothetical protein O7G85_16375, partial [Planctomycetota bacterium]|nr:hypothetical protein [Planctomycetota bacterium]
MIFRSALILLSLIAISGSGCSTPSSSTSTTKRDVVSSDSGANIDQLSASERHIAIDPELTMQGDLPPFPPGIDPAALHLRPSDDRKAWL